MKVIYVPKGRAREYSPLACNLYTGCAHGCRYCYAPSVLRKTRFAFVANVKPRAGILRAVERDAANLPAGAGPVLLCFTCDPYQPCEAQHAITRNAIEILGKAGLGIRVLTKAGTLPERDFDLFVKYDVEFGLTILFNHDTERESWEPHAGTIRDRIGLLHVAHNRGIRTWVSIEPVIYPVQAVGLVHDLSHLVGYWRVGKLNHDKAREEKIDWRAFLEDILAELGRQDASYYIKQDLWEFADDAIRAAHPQRNGAPE